MPGTLAGGRKASATNKKKHGLDFYTNIGRMGGKACVSKGFGKSSDRAKTAGALGGKHSKRGYKFIEEINGVCIYRNNTTGKVEAFVVK